MDDWDDDFFYEQHDWDDPIPNHDDTCWDDPFLESW
jgi:hypothetical protein